MKKIGFYTWGEGDNPWVLFHGWGFNSRIWHSFIPLLQISLPKSAVIAVDLPGFGETVYQDWPIFKQKLLEQLPQKFKLLGWSLGGLLASRLAIEAPERVSRLVNVASTPYFVNELAWPGIPTEQLEQFYQQFLKNPQQTQAQFIASQTGRPLTCPIQVTALGLEKGLDMLQTWDLRSYLPELKVPTHYIFGRLDRIVPSELMQVMQQRYSHFRYTLLSRSSHVPFLSHPDALLHCLVESDSC